MPIYQIGISFFKISLLIGYLRLLQGTSNKAYRGAIWCTVAFVSVSHVGSAMSLLFACQPIEKSWKPGRPGTCLPVDASFTVYSILTIVSDVIVAVLVCAFMLGLFTTLCSVFRYTQIKRIQFGDGNSTMLGCVGRDRIPRGHAMIMSSLPFLAPVCRRVAKEHCSKQSRHDGSSRGRYGAPGGASGQTTLPHAEAGVGESNGAHNRHSTIMVTRE
ncbi:hypothetical protein ARSEF4850_006904, partial [Beauveria asiatica]